MPLYQETEPQIVSRLADTLKAIRSTVNNAISAAGVTDPIEVLVGYPTWTEGTKVWAQPVDPGFVTIFQLPDVRMVTRYRPEWAQVGPTTVAFSATFTTAQVAFASVSAPSAAGTTIHVFFRAPGTQVYDAHYTTVANDTPSTVATAVATAITALAVSGVSAAAVGNAVNLTGAAFTAVNVGGFASAHKEVARVSRTVQVSIWVSSPWSRYAIQNAISSTLGAVDNCWLTLPDGGRVLILPKGEVFDDKSQESTNVYIAHLTFHVEYGVVQIATATQIGAVSVQQILQNELDAQIESINYIIS